MAKIYTYRPLNEWCMNCIYGPVASWRLGKSLGVDLICKPQKICSFDCIYCQLEHTDMITSRRNEFVSTSKIQKELQAALQQARPDVITFSGMGEPTLATNLGEVAALIRSITTLPLAILTNSSFLYQNDVAEPVRMLDHIVAKLDAPNEKLFQQISQPAEGITFENTLKGIKSVRKTCQGKFSLQIMFMQQNKSSVKQLADIAREINPDEVQINTPLRPCNIQPLSQQELHDIEQEFTGLHTLNVYTSPKPKTDPLDKLDMVKRRRFEP